MEKGMIPFKLVVYIILFLIIVVTLILMLNDIGLRVYNFTLPKSDTYIPMPQTSDEMAIENVRVFSGNEDVTDGRIIKGAEAYPFRIEFDSTLPKDSTYPKEGVDVEFVIQSVQNEKDFKNCLLTKKLAPGVITHATSEECTGGLQLESGWSGQVHAKISARVFGNPKATGYGYFNAYRKLSTFGTLCDAIRYEKSNPNLDIYLVNDVALTELGKITQDLPPITQGSFLTVDGTPCAVMVINAENALLLGIKFRNIETTPSLLAQEKLKISKNALLTLSSTEFTPCTISGSPLSEALFLLCKSYEALVGNTMVHLATGS